MWFSLTHIHEGLKKSTIKKGSWKKGSQSLSLLICRLTKLAHSLERPHQNTVAWRGEDSTLTNEVQTQENTTNNRWLQISILICPNLTWAYSSKEKHGEIRLTRRKNSIYSPALFSGSIACESLVFLHRLLSFHLIPQQHYL